jgi:hypothetical protein
MFLPPSIKYCHDKIYNKKNDQKFSLVLVGKFVRLSLYAGDNTICMEWDRQYDRLVKSKIQRENGEGGIVEETICPYKRL